VVLTTTDPAFIQVAAPRQVLHVHAGVLHPGEVLGRRQPASSDLPQEEE
jgi:hypothetical protein